ncbi:MAG TPA: murein biosynthesis integral membrane protein MurJ [Bryobacteraceae bacterium]|jgi:putative peptidoglycan lipid II flippase|nr:murein biosynthesis integral membrane protein MurJ [Bryobacteraceae bacterium]
MTSGETAPKPGLLQSAGIISAAVAASRVTGVLRESVLGWMFGAGATYDAYVLGYRIPSLARELFAEGALSSAFIPTFTRYLATKTPEETRELSNITATMLTIITGSICALGMLFSPAIVNLFAPGFHAVPGKWELAVSLVRTMFPFLLLLALAAQAQGMLYASHRFGVPAASSSLFNIASVISGYALGRWFGIDPVHGMATGVVIGGAAQLGFQLPSLWRLGFVWKPRLRLRKNLQHEGVRHILWLMGPAVIGSASGQINILVNTNFAAGLRDASGHVMNGPVSWLAYAYRFFALPMGVFGVAIASATLPRISHSAAMRNFVEFRETLSRSIVMILLLTVPSSIGLAILGESMIGIIFQHGRFLAFDTHQTALALQCYAVGLAGYSALKIIAPAFYALGDARTPMMVSLVSVLVNGACAFSMVRLAGFGFAGLALSTSIVSTFSSITLLMLLRGRIGGIHGWQMAISVVKVGAAAAFMGCVCYAIVLGSHAVLQGAAARLADITIGIPAGAASFYFAAAALRIPELAEARESVLRRFDRKPEPLLN